ncbi:basic salivary proline-rich protein 4-like [Cervus elaphus]|uniref:basic salivary proline-rich protein 4-like n=1 Tax=Cervus elaphus TaxID=9860 RepID=UPI001CC29FB4|nr:basic salivary proline-rich protein 4-like [Cervus elaphus]XP_043752864.1 basic salivary proline-rich protein 4-like [Cervus elaphus]XP_043752865.1 basic salivary proline-rich protein 4-like [Cervus elaphus]XP_043752866.1 basic salivary proline-rich protein 4-like [Cervus elaphus]XP_043752867.1 basic salivary proline-rich protein 4-like [Cervus elaphus]XP_043752868.1 basic salivary proline-rich protein 4-like [Cervus elaphus]XP_043752870.1 basic salivary proline-rich protein 4-like [Cervus
MAFHRQKYWSGLPSPTPGDVPKPGIEPGSPALQADAFPSEPPGKPLARYLERGRRATARLSTTTAAAAAASPPAGLDPAGPVTHGGSQCAGRPPPGGPRRRQKTTPTSPRSGQSPPPPPPTPVRPPPPPPPPRTPSSALNHRGPLPAPAAQAPSSLHHQGQRGREAWRQAGRDTTEVRGRDTRQPREAWGGVAGSKPRGSEGVRRRLATARQAQSSGRRPAEANRSRASGGTRRAGKRPSDGEPPAVTPHSPQDATGGSALCGLRLGGRQPWPAPRARRPRWGGGALSTSHHHPPPHPTPRTQPRGNLAGRSGGRGTPETPPPGAGQGWRGRPAEDGGAGGKAEESRLSQPTRTLHAAPPHSLPRGPSSQAAFPPLPSKSGQVNDPSPGSTMENLSADLSIIQG